MKLNLPSWATTTLGCIAGILAILTELVFAPNTAWGIYITVSLIFLSGIGISPLVGPAFRSALHLSAQVSLLICSGLAALAVALTTVHMASDVHAVLAGIFAFASALGFGPAPVIVPVPVKPAPAKRAAKKAA